MESLQRSPPLAAATKIPFSTLMGVKVGEKLRRLRTDGNDSVSAQLSIKSPNGQRNAKSKAKPNGLAHKS